MIERNLTKLILAVAQSDIDPSDTLVEYEQWEIADKYCCVKLFKEYSFMILEKNKKLSLFRKHTFSSSVGFLHKKLCQSSVDLQQQAGAMWWLHERGRAAARKAH